MEKARKVSTVSAQRIGNGVVADGPEVQAGKGKLSQVYGVRKKSITPAQFRESLRKEAKAERQADKRKEGIVKKAKELWRRDSPKKKEANGERLPPSFLLLERYFEGLEAATSLLRTRRKMCTFTAVAKTVENMTGRRFTSKHLAQIKYIFPEVLGLELVSYKDPDTSKITRDLKVTLFSVSVDAAPGAAAVDGNLGKERYRTKEVSRKEEFRAKLLAHVKTHPEAEEIPEAVVPHHYTVAESAKELFSAQLDHSPSRSPAQASGNSELLSLQGEEAACIDDSRNLDQPLLQDASGFKVPRDVPRKLDFSIAADEAEPTVATAEKLDGMSHFGALFKPFFSVRPSESGFKVPPDVPGGLNISTAAEAETEDLKDTRMSHFAPSFRPSFSVKRGESGFKVLRDVPRKLNFGIAAGQEQSRAADAEELDCTGISPTGASAGLPFAVERVTDPLMSSPSPAISVDALKSPIHSHQAALQPSDVAYDTSLFQEFSTPKPAVATHGELSLLSSRRVVANLFESPSQLETESLSECQSSSQFSQTPESGCEKTPFLRGGNMKRYTSFSLRPCDAAKSLATAAGSSSPCPSSPHDSPLPGTPFQPSPFVGYSQHFVSKLSASSPLQPSSSQALDKPLSSTPVRPQTAVRGLRFGTPVAAKAGMESGSESADDLHASSEPGAAKLDAAKAFSCREKRETSFGSVTPTRSAHEPNHTENPNNVGSLSNSLGYASAKDMRHFSATPGPSTPLLSSQEVRPRLQSDDGSPANVLLLQHHQTPKRSRVNLGLIFDQDPEGQESSKPFMSPSKKLNATVLEQEQVQERRDVLIPGQGVEGENVQLRVPSKPKAEASFDPEIVKCLPTRLVQSVRETERRALDEKSRGVAEQRKLAQKMADLPKLFSILRQIFQDRSVLPHQVLLSKVLSSNGGLIDSFEVEERLQLLLNLAPDWISLKTSSTGDRLYRISKTVDVVGIRKRIASSI